MILEPVLLECGGFFGGVAGIFGQKKEANTFLHSPLVFGLILLLAEFPSGDSAKKEKLVYFIFSYPPPSVGRNISISISFFLS